MVYPIGPKFALFDGDVCVQFDYMIAGTSHTFVVTREALEQHFELATGEFDSTEAQLAIWDAFHRGWERIRNVAARIRRPAPDNLIVLTASDFAVK